MSSLDAQAAVELWLIATDWSEESLQRANASLSAAEQRRVARLVASADRTQHTVSLAARRVILADKLGVLPEQLRYDVASGGKPGLGGEWFFSVADTHGLVVLAVGRGFELGIDVEHRGRQLRNLNELADHILSPAELMSWKQSVAEQNRGLLLRHWVLKEAFTKCVGEGLSYGFNRITLSPDSSDGRLLQNSGVPAYPAASYTLSELMVAADYHIALCVQGLPVKVTTFAWHNSPLAGCFGSPSG